MTMADEEVLERIMVELQREKLLSSAGLRRLREKLSLGALSASDWRLLFETELPDLAETDGD